MKRANLARAQRLCETIDNHERRAKEAKTGEIKIYVNQLLVEIPDDHREFLRRVIADTYQARIVKITKELEAL